MRGRRWAPPDIEIPGRNGARGYTSLRDIMSSPKAAGGSCSCSPDEAGAGAVAGDVHMIRHPLVKHAAYAYLSGFMEGYETWTEHGERASPLRQRRRLRSPLATTSSGSVNGAGAGGDFEFRHSWKRVSGGGMRGRRWAPPDIEIPRSGSGNSARGYTSLRDIMSSPKAAGGSCSCSPDDAAAAAAGDVHMIRHPLVKHAAYAYLQLTPSGRDAEEAWRRRQQRRRGGVLGRALSGCLGFLGALFGRR
ncbi:hypothetical protein U9M48_005162, partial [Paspalum notatum var. saurae]